MASREELETALIRADDAGDTESATALALQLQALQGSRPGLVARAWESLKEGASRPEVAGTARRWGAIAAAAPAKAIAGITDFATALNNQAAPPAFRGQGRETNLVGKVNDLTDTLAGEKVPDSFGRTVFEGAITAPMAGARGLAGLAAGGTAAGGAYALPKALPEEANEWERLVAAVVGSILGGKAAGKAVEATGVRWPGMNSAQAKVREAGSELSRQDWDEAVARAQRVRDAGGEILPSQAFTYPAPGMESLEQALLASHLRAADPLRRRAVQQPRQTDKLRGDVARGAGGPALDRSTPALFQPASSWNNEAAREGARRALTVLEGMSRNVPVPGRGATPSIVREGTRATLGTPGMAASVTARAAGLITNHATDRALLRIWNAPDGVERLARIAQMPPNQLTPAAVLAVLPELMENGNGP